MLKIITEPNKVLHQKCEPITEFSDDLKKLASDMRATMHSNKGMGLAAPQINKSIRLTVIEYLPKDKDGNLIKSEVIPFIALVNPEITWTSSKTVQIAEGCLSIPGFEGEVIRPKRVKVKAQNLNGEKIVLKASGLLARIVQHEIDHLNGILYSEKLAPNSSLQPVKPAI